MNRDVFLTRKAERQLRAAARWYAERDATVADRWLNGIVTAIDGLTTNPERFSHARESQDVPLELREMRFGLGRRPTHRVLFTIRPDKIVVHQVRHVAQRDVSDGE